MLCACCILVLCSDIVFLDSGAIVFFYCSLIVFRFGGGIDGETEKYISSEKYGMFV